MLNFIYSFFQQLKAKNETLFYFGAICFVLAFVFLLLTKITTTQVYNVSAWYKPFKFAVSIAIYSWTMLWYCYYLPKFNIQLFNWVVVALLGFEIVYIGIQAARGQLSHYNLSSPLYAALYAAMGLAASAVTLYTAYIDILFFKNSFPDLPSAYLWAIRLGIFIFVIFSFEGALMGSRLTHTIGGADGGQGLPFLNWSTKYGDPRVAHFVGMHALQVLPLLAFYVLRNTKMIFFVSAVYLLIAAYTLVQALRGKPLYSAQNKIQNEAIQ